MKLQFDTHGNDKQKLCAQYWVDHETDDIVYGGSKGSGKSFLGVSLIFGDAFIYPGTHYFIARKKLNDIRKYTIPSIHEVFDVWGVSDGYYNYNGQDNYFQLYNGSRVYLIDAKYIPSDPEYYRFGSMQMTRGWIEEAGEFEEKSYQNLKISIGRWKNDEYRLKGKILQTCNPARNYLKHKVYNPFKKNELPKHIKFIQALPKDNKMLDDGYLEMLERTLSNNDKQRLLYGDWDYDDDPNALIEYDAILDLWTNQIEDFENMYISADIALEGSDRAVLGAWDGLKLIDILVIDKMDAEELLKAINSFKAKHGVRNSRIVFDGDGLGAYLKGFLRGAKPFNNNGKQIETKEGTQYQNLKTQCYYKLAAMINQGSIAIDKIKDDQVQEDLIQELGQVKRWHSEKDGKLKIQPKEVTIKNIGRSPDLSDMMMMRMLFVLKPPKRGGAIVVSV
jgi:hypothetical protein